MHSETDPADRVATITMRTAVRDAAQLRKVLKQLGGLANVLRVARSG